ncbi:hypothetical protein E2C01_038188 [Portunus trituberculatus]|uniref:Uncharacterized protein n=1 Tax=Portunus trituberculatus TaxID=210409 RepID=A0A5B7FG60_PORTR|nr:hypothetical protein [Portunus trituberculatus]
MVTECLERLIERPSGISGYRPASWCAVCGRTGSSPKVKRYSTPACPNLCHAECLGEESYFKCSNTGQLRARAGISDLVTLQSSAIQPTSPPITVLAEQDTENGLRDLRKEGLEKLVKNLRCELASTKNQLHSYRTVTDDLTIKRRVLVEALNIVDTLIATSASDGIKQRSVACTARPRKIGEKGAAAAAVDKIPKEPGPSPPPNLPPAPSPSPDSSLPTSEEERETSSEEEVTPSDKENTTSSTSVESESERQLRPQQLNPQQGSPQINSSPRRRDTRKKRAARTGNTASGGGTAPEPRRQPRHRATPPRLQQQRQQQQQQHQRRQQQQQQQRGKCKWQGHTREQCPRVCEY